MFCIWLFHLFLTLKTQKIWMICNQFQEFRHWNEKAFNLVDFSIEALSNTYYNYSFRLSIVPKHNIRTIKLEMWHLDSTTRRKFQFKLTSPINPFLLFYINDMKQVFDDVAVEMSMALLQFFSAKPTEEHLFRTLKALSKFVTVRESFFSLKNHIEDV